MKIKRKPVKALVECPLCNCVFEIKGKDWRKVEDSKLTHTDYFAYCPVCHHPKKIIPAEVKCAK